ncbi:MAG TPA: hypothetical protein VGI15_06180, partial [Candidatus Cybelea sp.]
AARSRADATSSQSRWGAPREDIVAARRERRQKAKVARSVSPAPVQRYRKRRPEENGAVAIEEPLLTQEESIDPLDAQKAGLHDAALEQGHEEISLNLEDSTEQQHSSAERPEEGGAP